MLHRKALTACITRFGMPDTLNAREEGTPKHLKHSSAIYKELVMPTAILKDAVSQTVVQDPVLLAVVKPEISFLKHAGEKKKRREERGKEEMRTVQLMRDQLGERKTR